MAGPLWWAGPRRLALRESCAAPKMHVLEGLYIGPVDRSCLFIPREGQGDANIEDGDRRVFSWKEALLKMPQVNHTRLTIKLLRYPVRQQQILSALVKGHAPFLQARAWILRRAAITGAFPPLGSASTVTQDLYSLENWWLNISLTSSLLRPGEEGVQENHKLIGEKVEGRREKKGFPTHNL